MKNKEVPSVTFLAPTPVSVSGTFTFSRDQTIFRQSIFQECERFFSKVNFLKEYLPKLSFSKVQFKKAYFPKAFFSKCIGPKHVYCKAYLDVPHLLSFCKLVFESQRKPTLFGPDVHTGRPDFIFSYNTAEPSDLTNLMSVCCWRLFPAWNCFHRGEETFPS